MITRVLENIYQALE